MLLASDRDGLEPCVDAERSQQVPDVIPHRFGTQVQLLGDLLGRAAPLEQTQNLGLPWREMRRKRIVGLLFDVGDLSEDADESMPVHQRAGADIDLDATTVGVNEDHLRIGHAR
jgi:hypothetical protein